MFWMVLFMSMMTILAIGWIMLTANPDDFDIYLHVTFRPEPVNVVTPGVTYQENSVVLGVSVSANVDYSGNRPNYLELGGCDGCPGVTFLSDPVKVVTDDLPGQN